MPSTREVAQVAGVSIGTVSRVVNNKPGVSESTRQRVLETLQQLSYTRQPLLPLVSVTHLGLLIRPMRQALSANPFYADVYHGVEQICRELRVNLSLSAVDMVDERLRSLPALVGDERIAGTILVGAIPREMAETLATAIRTPMVLVDNWYDDCPWDGVMIDNRTGTRRAVEHLIAQGHRHIALVGGPAHPSIVERRAAYEDVLHAHGLDPAVITATWLEPGDGEAVVEPLLQTWPQTTAILCSNDSQAIGVLRKLQALGYRVPEDFSLVGFDDITHSEITTPPITTVRVDRLSLGRIAVELLLSRLTNPDRPAVKCIVGVHLVERASVSHPRLESTINEQLPSVSQGLTLASADGT